MHKKFLYTFVILAMLFGAFGMMGPGGVSTAQANWANNRPGTPTILPFFTHQDLTFNSVDGAGDFGGCTGAPSFGNYQRHLLIEEAQMSDYVRVRIQATGANIEESAWAVSIRSTAAGFPELGCALAPADGLIDLVVPAPATGDVVVTLASHGIFEPTDEIFYTWILTSEFENGGLIVDMRDDCGTIVDRKVQASQEDSAVWGVHFPAPPTKQMFIDVDAGTYNIGVQDKGTDPFVAYYDEVEVGSPGYIELTPCEDATKEVTVNVACALQIGGADVFVNMTEGTGFLFESLNPGQLSDPGTYGELTFRLNPYQYWDVAVVQDGTIMNYFLIAQAFNVLDRNITFDLCDPDFGVDWIQPNYDEDWDSALLKLTPPSNFETVIFDIYGSEVEDGYRYENVVLKVDPGCCGPDGIFIAEEVHLDIFACEPDECCEGDPFEIIGPATAVANGDQSNDCPYWWYHFEPVITEWSFGEETVFGSAGRPITDTGIFWFVGDGPFEMNPSGVSAKEYDVAAQNGEVIHERGPWTDAIGNILIKMLEDGVDVFPVYTLTYGVTQTTTTLDDSSWDITPFTHDNDIGRYKYTWMLPHGYLGDINGFESEFIEVCCLDIGVCPTELIDQEFDVCEIPFVSGGEALYAISPTDVRMNAGWPWSWVMAMYEWDLTSGINATHYDPTGTVTRGQMAGFIANTMKALGVPEKAGVAFDDVPEGAPFQASIEMLRAYNVVSGIGNNLYAPDAPVTRAQMAIFIQNAFRTINFETGATFWWDVNQNVKFPPTVPTFTDVPTTYWAYLQIEEMVYDGLTSGCMPVDAQPGLRYYCPDEAVTRGQMATFITNAIAEQDVLQAFWPIFAPEK